MLDYSRCTNYYNDTLEWAKQHKLYEGEHHLKELLEYLDAYADREKKGLTKCVLSKDYAPHSFSFTMYRRTVCRCGEDHVLCYQHPSSGVLVEWDFMMNGGLIFHSAEATWSVHT